MVQGPANSPRPLICPAGIFSPKGRRDSFVEAKQSHSEQAKCRAGVLLRFKGYRIAFGVRDDNLPKNMIQTAVHVPARWKRRAVEYECKGPERWATTHNFNRTRSPNVPARHFTVPNFRASTGCFSSKPLRHPIPSLRWQTGRNAGRADSPYPRINPKS